MKRLDHHVTQKATMIAIIFGVLSALILGTGMCFSMVWAEHLFYQGIIIGLIGMVGVGVTMPLYRHVLKIERHKVADTILELSQQISQQ